MPNVATVRKPALAAVIIAAVGLALALVLLKLDGPTSAKASSHSEAPLISQDPRADNTDLYAFVSPDDTSKVTMIANYIPLEAPASGPNFYSFDDSVLYQIAIDNTGDGVPDIGYQFRFTTQTRNPNTFLYGTGPITSLDSTSWNRPQTYTVTLVHFNKHGNVQPGGPSGPVVIGTNVPTPPDNVGPRTTPNYDSLASAAVTSLGNGVNVFAGQRDDPFFVDLGSIFDLGGLRPFNPFHLIPLAASPGVDALANYNTHSIAIQVPISQLIQAPMTTIGIYASADRAKIRVLKDDGTIDNNGPWVQVSRLGNPLVNEVLIPLGKKDYWNREDPWDDSQFEANYTSPELAGVDQPAVRRSSRRTSRRRAPAGRHDRPDRPEGDPAHRRAGAELHRLDRRGSPAAEHGAPTGRQRGLPRRDGVERRTRPDGRARRRLLRVPERPQARRRRDRHRAAGDRAGLRLDPGRCPRTAQQVTEQPRRRRRGRERRALLEHVPLRGLAAPGIRGALIRRKAPATGGRAQGPLPSGRRKEEP